MGESDFIAALKALASDPAARGLDDDAAVLELGSETLVLTHDVLVEGVHVRTDEDAADVAWKLVAVNLSDLAAKGAQPIGVLLGHMLGEGDARFIKGLREVLEAHDVPLLGGDTVRGSGPRSWGCTAIGRATHTPVPDRRNARAGDGVFVTGTLGRAMLGFEAADRDSDHALAYRRPSPLIAEGIALAPHVSAMMDVSDGLLLDCFRMAQASDISIDLDSSRFPVADSDMRDECVRWGDDYELLFTLPPETPLPVPATLIGKVGGDDLAPLWVDGEMIFPKDGIGYQH
ncbi:thiamine-phosphate kinase [Qipengyuania marisflavi]|uniref:Thiamine-monophosphate kinase n=1 Tax=Qipengyuania marisflavi TaxID=2486356 RepID=A0A5S3P713_9SPHN|nr:thiamine-phosphate kinase [Qipengyuania marisflavi]TMM48925.1 thiamine-phosphate kinase [Qipengyuania marisflavi]